MRRYLLVLDMDLLAQNEELDLEPINYLVARQEQERGEVVVLSVVANRQVKLSPMELLLGAATAHAMAAPVQVPYSAPAGPPCQCRRRAPYEPSRAAPEDHRLSGKWPDQRRGACKGGG